MLTKTRPNFTDAADYPGVFISHVTLRSLYALSNDGSAHLIRPALARLSGRAAPTGSSSPAGSSAATSWAAQVPEVNLQLGRDVVGGLAEVVIAGSVVYTSLIEITKRKRERGSFSFRLDPI